MTSNSLEDIDLRIQSDPGLHTVPRIAEMFSRLLCEEVGHDRINDIVIMNRHEFRHGVCHSHDFCDANMLMRDAILKVTGLDAADGILNNHLCINLWNNAWEYANIIQFNFQADE